MLIVPAPLEKTAKDVLFQITHLSPYFKRFQIDIADGIFVPNKTVQINELIPAFQQYNNVALKQLSFDFHLMIKDYVTALRELEELKKILNIQNVLIHSQVISSSDFQKYNNVNIQPFPLGLVLNPEDPVETIIQKYNLKHISSIQIMSVTPGKQGQPFIPKTLNKIEQLRQLDYRSPIMLDGAVNEKTLPLIARKKNKPDIVCPGSFLTRAKNLEKNVEFLSRYEKL